MYQMAQQVLSEDQLPSLIDLIEFTKREFENGKVQGLVFECSEHEGRWVLNIPKAQMFVERVMGVHNN